MKYLSSIALIIILIIGCQPNNKEAATSSEAEETFTVVEEYPTYEGGMDLLYDKLKKEITYPKAARVNNTEGQVEIGFIIERDGSISNTEVISGIGDGCDQEALRVVSGIESFVPGSQRGRTVRVKMSMPIVFKINPDANNPDGSPQGMVIINEAEIIKDSFRVDAQYSDGAWSGKVLSSDGEPLPGTNVIVAGTDNGTVVDLEGNFSLEAPEKAEVVFSFVGFETYRLVPN